MNSLKHMCFDKATLMDFCKYDAVLKLELEDVLVGEGRSDIVLTVEPVTIELITKMIPIIFWVSCVLMGIFYCI